MTDLPKGWEWQRVGDFADVSLGRQRSPKNHTGDHMRPYLRAANVKWDGIDLSDVKEMNFDPEEAQRFDLRDGDVLLNEASGSSGEVGKPAIWRGEIPGACFQNTLLRVRSQGPTPEYLHLYFWYTAKRGRFGDLGRGVNIRHLGKKGLVDFEVPIPPLDEQRRIVETTQDLLSRLEAATTLIDRALLQLNNLSLGFLRKRLNPWPEAELGEVSEVFVGTTPKRDRPDLWNGDVPWVSSGEVSFCRISKTRETISASAVRADRIHPPGTVLLGMIGEGKTRGQAAILDVAATHNQNSAAIRPDRSRLLPEWLYQVFRATYDDTRRAGSGGNQPALNRARVQALRVPLPPLDDQIAITAEMQRLDDYANHVQIELQAARRASHVMRSSILAAAFSGELTSPGAISV